MKISYLPVTNVGTAECIQLRKKSLAELLTVLQPAGDQVMSSRQPQSHQRVAQSHFPAKGRQGFRYLQEC